MSVGTMMSGMEGEDDWTINEDLGPCHLGSGHVRRTDRSGALSSLTGPYPRLRIAEPSSLWTIGLNGWPRVHEKRELVRKGPYSIVRNPLYISSVVGAAGVGAQSGSIANTVIFGAASLLIFYFVVLEEERFLAAAFPDAFAAYAAQVPRFWPRLSLWEDAGELLVTPRLVHWTFLDASLFLLALPVTSLIHGGSTWVGYRCCSTCPKRSLTWLRRGETNVGSADRNDRLP